MNFFKKWKKLQILLLFAIFILPANVFAYSKYIIPGGETIGIEVNSNGVYVVGFYDVNGENIGKDAGFKVGDKIIAINNEKITSISSMIDKINQEAGSTTLEVTVEREDKTSDLALKMKCDSENVCKTGLYVKDEITGIGTLTYIDPNTKIFGALGHEIMEKTTGEKFEIKDGKIFKADVTNTTRSSNGSPGEKNATYDKNVVFGKITANEEVGIFGKYQDTFASTNTLEVAEEKEVTTGEATIRTVLKDNEVKEYAINIIRIDKNSDTKNILFEITDQTLLQETGGVIQGMSGSPIIQNNKIIGAVTHVIVNDTKKGYGIFITTMLDEGDKSI